MPLICYPVQRLIITYTAWNARKEGGSGSSAGMLIIINEYGGIVSQ